MKDPDQPGALPERVGGFVVEALVGRGGMGRVYRARDAELGRAVALKALTPELASDPERIGLLMREAKALASINHPNIEIIHGLAQGEDGTRYVVLEYLEGERLVDRLGRGALPLAEALRAGVEIAAALEAAHERGVVHRDLTPGNVMLLPSGRLKVLDFGIASLGASRGASRGAATPPSRATLTETPDAAGTLGYASPEQMRGDPQDRRTDLFAFGCVLFESLAGRRAFEGGSAMKVMASVLEEAPPWHRLPETTPESVRRLLERCLRANPNRRQRDAGDARLLLEDALGELARGARGRLASSRPAAVLPIPATKFIGREEELVACARLLARTRLLTLTGLGGSGKTRLALALAERVAHDAPDGVHFVDLAPVADPDRVAHAVLAAAGLQEAPDRTSEEVLAAAWQERQTLLVLDNCEHVLGASAHLIATLLAGTRSLRVIATSREPLHAAGEQIYGVPPLALAPPARSRGAAGAAETVGSPSEAALLFGERAASAASTFALGERNRGTVEAICALLDGLPLAIELAAARVRVLDVDRLLASLPDRFRLLDGGVRGAERHRTLRGVIDWSYGLLGPHEQSFFRALSVFAGGFTLEAAAAVCGVDELGAVDVLEPLIDKSLVQRPAAVEHEAAPTRYRLLETIRQYAAERLEEHGDRDAARVRHAAYFTAAAERAGPELTGPAQREWLNRIGADHDNFLAALAWCDATPDRSARAVRIAGGIWRFWLARGHFKLGRAQLEAALDRPSAAGDVSARGDALIGAASLAFHQNDWYEADRHYNACRDLMTAAGNETGVGFAMSGLGNTALGRGDYAAARARYEDALARFDRGGHVRGKGLALSNLGRVAELQGDLARARSLYEQGLAIFEEVGDIAASAVRLSSFAELCLRLGDLEAARARLVACVPLVRGLEEKRAGAYAIERTAMLAERLGDPATAARLCAAASALRRQIASPHTPKESEAHQAFLRRAEAAVGTRAGAIAEEGGKLSFEEALQEAFDWLLRPETERSAKEAAPATSPG